MNREDAISDDFHKVSNMIIQICKEYEIKELIIGYNVNWKKGVNIGRQNNKKFYQVPYRKLLNMLFYKGAENGIKVVENEEAYTSKCDALALEDVGFHETYSGRRVKRGLFESAMGVLLNADVNGAINIMRKYVNKAYTSLTGMLNAIIDSTPFSRLCNPIKVKNVKPHLMTASGVQGWLRGRDLPSSDR
jgi:putative transposase